MKKSLPSNTYKTLLVLRKTRKCKLQQLLYGLLFFLLLGAGNAFGQIAQRGSATTATNSSSSSTLTITKPTGVVAGDVLIVNILQNETDNDNGGLSAANLTGWIQVDARLIRSDGTGNGSNAWYGTILYRVATGSEGTNFAFTLPNSRADMAIGSIVAFSGVDATGGVKADGTSGGPFDIDPGTLNLANASSATANGITTTTNNAALIMFAQVNNDIDFSSWATTSPGTLTELYDNKTTSSDDGSVGAAWAIDLVAGSTGDGTVTLSASARNGAILIALKASCETVGDASSTPTLCADTVLTNITHTTTKATGIGTPTGLPEGVTAAWSSNTITISGTPSESGTFNYSIPLTGGCGGIAATGTITVNPIPTAVTATPSASTICAGGSVTLTSTSSFLPSTVNGSISPSASIPDGDTTTGVSSLITLPSTCASASEISSVTVNITHTWANDLDIYLVSPNGTQIALCTDKGSDSDNLIATFQTGGSGLTTTATPINGTYAPQTAFSDLSGAATGSWTLKLFDDTSQDIGILNSWSITINSATCGVLTYSWSPATGLSSSTVQNPVATPTTTTNYSVTVTAPNGCSATSAATTVTVRPTFTAGAISTINETICYNGNPALIGSTTAASGGDESITYKWQANGADIASSNAATYDPPTSLTSTTTYTRFAKDATCNTTFTQSTGSYVVTVRPNFTAGAISTINETICYNGNPALIGSTTAASGGDASITYKWQANGADIASSNAATYDPPTSLTATTTYTRFAKDATCNTTFTQSTGSYVVTVRPNFTAGAISTTNATICYNGNPALIGSTTAASGGNASITYKWQANGVDIASSNAATYDPPTSLTATTTYTRFAKDGLCNTTFIQSTGSYVVTVNPLPTATAGGTQTICANSTATVSGASSSNGTIAWTENGAGSITAGSTTLTPTYTPAVGDAGNTVTLTMTVSNSPCSAATATYAVVVTPLTTNGSVTTSVCDSYAWAANGQTYTTSGVYTHVVGCNTATLNLTITPSSTNGSVTTSTCGSYTWAANGQTYTTSGVYTHSVGCNTATLNVTITPATVGGSITGSTLVCFGSAAPLTLTGQAGTVIRWEKASDDDFTAPVTIASTATTLTEAAMGNVFATTYFRAVVQNGDCSSAYSEEAVLTVASTTWNGSNWSNGAPTSATTAIIAGDYSSQTNGGGINACVLTVTNNANVIISSGHNVILRGALTVNTGSTFTLNDGANLMQTTNVQNVSSIIVKKETTLLKKLDGVLWSSPVSGTQKLKDVSPLTINSYFYAYNILADTWNVVNPTTTSFQSGKGYLIRTPNNHPTTPTKWNVSFAGVPNNGDISISCGNTGDTEKYFLIGNPYPSPIKIDDFLAANPNITGVFYFFRKTNGTSVTGYSILNKAPNGSWEFSQNRPGQGQNPNGYIPSGQGFFVAMKTGIVDGVVNFNNDMRSLEQNGNFNRSLETIVPQSNKYELQMTTAAGAFSKMHVGYYEGSTNGYDSGFDALAFNDGAYDLSSVIGSENYRIQARSTFDSSDIVPLRFKTNVAGEYKISIAATEGLFAQSQNVYIKDNVTGVKHNLKTADYVFTATSGTVNSRFEIVYTNAITYYADADGDGYGNAAVTLSAETPPTGYVLNATDCDDSNAAVHPGAVDVCYDGLDNDCNGIIDNTCTPIVSKVIVSQCGQTLAKIDDYVYADLVSGAQGYRFKVTNMATSQVQSIDRFLRVFRITQLPNYAFNTEYKVEVAVKFNNVWQPFYGAPCTVTTPATTTQLIACGITLSSMTDIIYAHSVPFATGYRFMVTNAANPSDTQVIDRHLREFRMNLLTGIQNNSNYMVQVAVRNTDGTYLPYGAACKVATPSTARTSDPEIYETKTSFPSFAPVAYPNPFSESFSILLPTESTDLVQLLVYDLLGKLIDKKEIKHDELEQFKLGQQYASGDYLLVVTQGAAIKTLHIIKR